MASQVAQGDCFAHVLLNLTARNLQGQVFTYRVPEEFRAAVRVGQPVLVSFGAQHDVTGFITGLSATYDGPHQVKELSDILDEHPLFDEVYYDFIQWVASYYATPVSQVLDCALPANLIQKARKLVYQGPAMTDPLAVARIQHEKNGRKALQLVDFLYRNTLSYEDAQVTPGARGFTVRYLAGQLRLPMKALRQLLARMKSMGLVSVETELKDKTSTKYVRQVGLSPDASLDGLSRRQHELVCELKARGDEWLAASVVIEALSTTMPTLKKLEEQGVLRFRDVPVVRDPLAVYTAVEGGSTFQLSRYQRAAFDAVVQGDSSSPYLLYGVTGSGKTEVYMALARQALEQGRSVLVMVPEIALTSQIARRFIEHFGVENIALWHSNLSDGEKADTWNQLRDGQLKILIGARSAVWAPMKRLGLILIDEEHEGSYKQDSPAPRYNAKTLAEELARRHGAKLVLGSATPEISTFYRASREGRILSLPERFGGRPLADVQVVDMKQERSHGNRNELSRPLQEALQANLDSGEQSIILLNRRGFYTTIQCVTCDYVFMCPQCDVAMTFHRTHNRVVCHYCGHDDERPQFCPVCASLELNMTGVGTQRIEDELVRTFPDARIARLDSDIMQRKHAHREVFDAFARGESDILIGTQIVAKGLDVANVTLVGVISADASFALPDYKSAERGFQLLTQVAGRAGRGDKPGRVIIQAVQTGHMVLQHTQCQDYDAFYAEEIVQRESLNFPPYSQLFRFIVSGENEKAAHQFAQSGAFHLRELLKQADLAERLQFMGPAPCVLPRIQGRYRFHFLVKNQAGVEGQQVVSDFYRQAMEARLPDGLNFILDTDAQSLL